MTKGVSSLSEFRRTRTYVMLEAVSSKLDELDKKIKVLENFLTENAIRLTVLENQGKR